MTFEPELLGDFLAFFEPFATKIRNFPGCTYLQILQDKDSPNVIFSYSHWCDEADLDNYRNSDLFKSIWPKTKSMFLAKAEAWTTTLLKDLV